MYKYMQKRCAGSVLLATFTLGCCGTTTVFAQENTNSAKTTSYSSTNSTEKDSSAEPTLREQIKNWVVLGVSVFALVCAIIYIYHKKEAIVRFYEEHKEQFKEVIEGLFHPSFSGLLDSHYMLNDGSGNPVDVRHNYDDLLKKTS